MANTTLDLENLNEQKYIGADYKSIKLQYKTLVPYRPYNLLSNDLGTLTFARNSSAYNPHTGQTVGNNVARTRPIFINNNVYNAYLIEGERTNSIDYSEDIFQHNQVGGVISDPSITLEGIPLRRFTEDTSNGEHRIIASNCYVASTQNVLSVYIKNTSQRNITLTAQESGTGNSAKRTFDTTTGDWKVGDSGASGGDFVYDDGFIETFTDGWRVSMVFTAGAVLSGNPGCRVRMHDGSSESYTGDGVSYIDIGGLQCEQGAFPSSYIKTTGTSATRLADNLQNNLNNGFINSGTWISSVLPYGGTWGDRTDGASDAFIYHYGNEIVAGRVPDIATRRTDTIGNNYLGSDINKSSENGIFTVGHVWGVDTNKQRNYVDGVFGNENTNTPPYSDLTSIPYIQIGAHEDLNTTKSSFAWIFILSFEEALSDSEILQIHNSMRLP